MTKVFTAQHPTEAHLVAELLKSGGIEAEIRGEAVFAARGYVPITEDTLPTVWVVDDGQVDEALRVIGTRSTTPTAGTSWDRSWKCPQCGEMVEPQFTACWNCGTNKPDA